MSVSKLEKEREEKNSLINMWHSAYCMFHGEKRSFIGSGVVYMNMQFKMQSEKAVMEVNLMQFYKASTILLLNHEKTFIFISVL